MRLGNTPQVGVLFGMTGADKSAIIADLLAQIGHRLGFQVDPKRRLVARRAEHRVRAASRSS
jgi:hypothetical protein